ncbi:MAG: HDOD domain-containing protein [Planctomycetes bacterium]|nr:HDOD domain-containing protein [Planctomycetota bacterium]
MHAWALTDATVDLPWLSPSGESLTTLARSPTPADWPEVRQDPGAVLLVVRRPGWDKPVFPAAILRDPALLQDAVSRLDKPGCIDWHHPAASAVLAIGLKQARLAHRLAGALPQVDAECAWVGALLAPLGWFGMAAVRADALADCLNHADFPGRAAALQTDAWGLDHTALARRLCRTWRLPGWLTATIGHLGLPATIGVADEAQARLQQVVQLAVGLVQEIKGGLGLAVGAAPERLIVELGLSRDVVDAALRDAGDALAALPELTPPARMPMLADHLRLTMDLRRGDGPVAQDRLQQDLERLQRTLEAQHAGEKRRLEEMKLDALAEFAAGAGHEINNPLAVISGQAQYLLGHESEPAHCKSLQTIIGQAHRIHQILKDLMCFARPSPPKKQALDVNELIHDLSEELHELADRQEVRLECLPAAALPGRLMADRAQVTRILYNLLRNGIEAVPAEGLVALRVDCPDPGWVEFIVEDTGPGPSEIARAHLFDPFFSGRSAGRGRGLGLSTAWQLAKQNGGEVRFVDAKDGKTRFVVRLPLSAHQVAGGYELNGQAGAARAAG